MWYYRLAMVQVVSREMGIEPKMLLVGTRLALLLTGRRERVR
jgi:hypothetical protein